MREHKREGLLMHFYWLQVKGSDSNKTRLNPPFSTKGNRWTNQDYGS